MELKKLERFFLSMLVKIILMGIGVIFIADLLLYPEDKISLLIDVVILATMLVAFFIQQKAPLTSVLLITCIPLVAMIYQSLIVPLNTTTSLSVILVIGFVFSILLRGRLLWVMHAITYSSIVGIFIIQIINPKLSFSSNIGEVLSVVITYSILYFIITYSTGVLKFHYDRTHEYLRGANKELHNKAMEIEAQNEELVQIQDNLHEINIELENRVNERTQSLKIKTKKLIKYSYANAHHLRGPVARLLGLVAIQRLDPNPDFTFFFNKIEAQALEIDSVVKHINVELTTGDLVEDDLIT